MSTTTDDVFTVVHRALLSALTGYAPWVTAIGGIGNLERLDQGLQFPGNMTVGGQPGDAARFRVEQGKWECDLMEWDGQAVKGVLRHPITVTAGDLDVVKLNIVKWRTLQALVTVGHYLGMPHLVLRTTLSDGADTPNPGKDKSQGSRRWVTVCSINVELILQNEDVLAGAIPND